MTLSSPPAPATTAPTARPGRPDSGPGRLLAVVTDRETGLATLDEAYAQARETGREVHTALLLPSVPFTIDAALFAAFAEEADREAADLIALAGRRAAAAGVRAHIAVHRLGGLRGRRRLRVLDRAVARLASRLDAVPVGWPAR